MKLNSLPYTPQFFLASLGNGGLAASFYMYLMFMVPHKSTPMATFNDILSLIKAQNPAIALLIAIVLLGILWFAAQHFRTLFWNCKEYLKFRRTEAFDKLKSSNSEVQLMTIPLSFAMSINVLFILGAVFVPNIWSAIEPLFVGALFAFGAVGFFALKIFSAYFTRLIVNGDFDFVNNNSLSQSIAILALAMVGLGFAAPGAMSHNIITSALGLFGAVFFFTASASLAIVKLTLGLKSILERGISLDAAPSLWVFVPIMTVLGIAAIRMTNGFYHNLVHDQPNGAFLFLLSSAVLSVQLMFGIVGYKVLTKIDYFAQFVRGDKKSAGSYALICPGVGLFVFGLFFISWGVVYPQIIEKFSIAYFVLLAPFVYVQFITIRTMFRLNKKIFI